MCLFFAESSLVPFEPLVKHFKYSYTAVSFDVSFDFLNLILA